MPNAQDSNGIDLTVLMPCLNEEANLGLCIESAWNYIHACDLNGEVLVVDNGSTDGSVVVAQADGATVIHEDRRGYGRALRTGLAASKGAIVIFADADGTYDLLHLDPLYLPLAKGEADVVIGNRFAGKMEKGAMPLSHRLGVPFLSLCGRLRFHVDVRDFHCGIRGITRKALDRCVFHTSGMEFATEMVAEAARLGLKIAQPSVSLRKSPRPRTEKLRTVRDGLRHLRFIVRGGC